MAVRNAMVNARFRPNEAQEAILDVLADEYQANAARISDVTGLSRQHVYGSAKSLIDAGWIEKPNRGLYRFVKDPRK
jgi:DNA-binding IclR family transcriptional regulator